MSKLVAGALHGAHQQFQCTLGGAKLAVTKIGQEIYNENNDLGDYISSIRFQILYVSRFSNMLLSYSWLFMQAFILF